MRRFLALVCLSLAMAAAAQARPAIGPRPPSVSLTRIVTRWIATLWSSLRILPTDGGGTIPPPH